MMRGMRDGIYKALAMVKGMGECLPGGGGDAKCGGGGGGGDAKCGGGG